MRLVLIAAVSAAALLPVAAHAQIAPDFAGVRVSTLGVGAEFGLKLNDHFTVRAIGNGANFGYDETTDDGIRYDGDLKLASFGAQIDYRFAANGPLYLTAGAYKNDNKVEATGRYTQNVIVGGVPLTPEQVGTLSARADFDDTVPYLGLGARWPIGHFEFNLEAGAYFQGSPRVSLTSDSPFASDPNVQAAIETERADLEEDIKDYKTYPALTLGLRYKF